MLSCKYEMKNPVMHRSILLTSCFYLLAISVHARLSLPMIFTDNMVLQRDKPIKVWGTASSGEAITVSFNGVTGRSKADRSGHWMISLTPMKFGGPFTMTVSAKSGSLTYKNVMIGDVWICSGQSNMEWSVK